LHGSKFVTQRAAQYTWRTQFACGSCAYAYAAEPRIARPSANFGLPRLLLETLDGLSAAAAAETATKARMGKAEEPKPGMEKPGVAKAEAPETGAEKGATEAAGKAPAKANRN
jgi:hypothetical protein